jgi:MoxR-like ATPase
MELHDVRVLAEALRAQIGAVVFGQEEVIRGLLVALFSSGHVLLEGVPGTAKTLLAQTFAASLSLGFSRIQFTPDLLPGDILGSNLFNFQTNRFSLTKGPIFTDFLLADEINRTPPKTQSALLQAMQERVVSIDNTTHPLPSEFIVVATQNPVEQEGTYPLPEAQLDRFLLKLVVGYPSRETERQIVKRHGTSASPPRLELLGMKALATREMLQEARALVSLVTLSEEIANYIVELVRATREHPMVQHGASPRAAVVLAGAARALAVLLGRDYVIPDDVKELAPLALRHRLQLSPSAEIEGLSADKVLSQIISKIPAPR